MRSEEVMTLPAGWRQRGVSWITWALVVAYLATYSTLVLFKRHFFLYDEYDYAIFAQAVQLLSYGQFLNTIRGMNWLGDHGSLILFVIAPLVWLTRSAATLLVLQTIALALGAVPVFLLARRELSSERAANVFAACYLLYPAVGFLNLYEFHPEAFAVPLLLAAFYWLRRDRVLPCVAAAITAMLCREDVALVVLSMSLYALVLRKDGRKGRVALPLALSAIAILALNFGYLRPTFNRGESDFGLLYSHWGSTLPEAVRAIVARPTDALAQLVSTPGDPIDGRLKLTFYVTLLLPLCVLPLLAPEVLLIGIPVLLEHMLADGHEQHSIHYHYAALLIPVLFASAILGARRLFAPAVDAPQVQKPHRRLNWLIAGVALATVACAVWFGPLAPWSYRGVDAAERTFPSEADRTLQPLRARALSLVPGTGGVVASLRFLDRLADRSNVHAFHHVLTGHYAISRRPYPSPHNIVAMLVETDLEHTLESVDSGSAHRLQSLLEANDLRPVWAAGSILVYRSGVAPSDTLEMLRAVETDPTWSAGAVRFGGSLALLSDSLPSNGITPGQPFRCVTVWARERLLPGIVVMGMVARDARGHAIALETGWLGPLANPAHSWQAGVAMAVTDFPVLPTGCAPGTYAIEARVGTWDGRSIRLLSNDRPAPGGDSSLYKIGEVSVRQLGQHAGCANTVAQARGLE